MEKMTVKITFIDDVLGSQPNDAEIYSRFIASKAPDAKTIEQEVEEFGAVEVDEKGMTVLSVSVRCGRRPCRASAWRLRPLNVSARARQSCSTSSSTMKLTRRLFVNGSTTASTTGFRSGATAARAHLLGRNLLTSNGEPRFSVAAA